MNPALHLTRDEQNKLVRNGTIIIQRPAEPRYHVGRLVGPREIFITAVECNETTQKLHLTTRHTMLQ